MKKVPYIFFIALSLIFLGCTALKEKKAYEETVGASWEGYYENYLKDYPDGKHAAAVKDSLKDVKARNDWTYTDRNNTVSSYEYYIKQHPDSKFNPEAQKRITDLNEQKDYEKLIRQYDIQSLQEFLAKYPDSKHKSDVELKLNEEQGWINIKTNDSLQVAQAYIAKFPDGKYAAGVKNRITEIQTILPEWQKALKTNTEKGYKDFLYKYQNCTYSISAKEQLRKYEDVAWAKAQAKNTETAYKDFLLKFPLGFQEEAEKKVVDMEADGIFAGQHGDLPLGDGENGGGRILGDTITVKIKNDTEYPMTIWLSSPLSSKKVTIATSDSVSVRLLHGTYKIAAQSQAKNVNNYAGSETFIGGYIYSYSFYFQHHFEYNFPN